jgi:hypothetical protein
LFEFWPNKKAASSFGDGEKATFFGMNPEALFCGDFP